MLLTTNERGARDHAAAKLSNIAMHVCLMTIERLSAVQLPHVSMLVCLSMAKRQAQAEEMSSSLTHDSASRQRWPAPAPCPSLQPLDTAAEPCQSRWQRMPLGHPAGRLLVVPSQPPAQPIPAVMLVQELCFGPAKITVFQTETAAFQPPTLTSRDDKERLTVMDAALLQRLGGRVQPICISNQGFGASLSEVPVHAVLRPLCQLSPAQPNMARSKDQTQPVETRRDEPARGPCLPVASHVQLRSHVPPLRLP